MIGSDNVVLLVRVLMRWGNKSAGVLRAKPCGFGAARMVSHTWRDCVAVLSGCPVLVRFRGVSCWAVALGVGGPAGGAAVWKLGAGIGRSPAALRVLVLFLYIRTI